MKVNEAELVDMDVIKDYVKSQQIAEEKSLVKDDLLSLEVYKSETKIIKYINLIFKRIMDICGALIGTIILIPITIAVAIVNFVYGDHGPIFYTQERIGKNGKLFKIYKFRTMVIGADEKLDELLKEDEEKRKEYKKYKKLKDDPRVTKIGNFLRKTSLDEFPQFINVLKGEMSLVGPRPYLPEEKEDMDIYYECIIKKKPGITGPWQAHGRNALEFKDRVAMDMEYYHKSSFIDDVAILKDTVMSVVKKEGAA